MKKLLLALMFLSQWLFAGSNPLPPPSTPALEPWNAAVKAVQAGKFADAVPSLEIVVAKNWDIPFGQRAAALLIEAQLQNKNPKRAMVLAKRFLDCFPASLYRDRVETAVALMKIKDANVYAGVEDLLRIFAYSKNPNVTARVKDAVLQVLASSLLGSGELQSLLERSPRDHDILAYLNLQLGREHQIENRWKAARQDYARVVQENPGSAVAEAASQGIAALEGHGNGLPSLVVLAPLSGDYSEFGGEMVQGVLIAYDDFTAKNGRKVLLRIIDDRADPVRALHRVQDVIQQDDVIGIVGPMMSPAATAVGAWLAQTHPEIALVTPTATDEGISSIGSNVFQLNVPTTALARAIAIYSMQCLSAHEFAILSPLTDYGRIMSDEFSRTVESRGGQVLALQYYAEGQPDYRTEFNRLRVRKFNLDNRRRNIAKGMEAIDAVDAKERKEYLADSALSFDAVFIPSADPSDAAKMASHTAFNKVQAKLLGSSGWYGKSLIVDGKKIVENSFFSVPFTETTEDEAYQRFTKEFATRWDGAQPAKDKVSGLSHDAARIMLDAWQKGQGKDLPQTILATKSFPGVYGAYQFDSTGANAAFHMVTVQKGKFVFSDSCATPTTAK